jgi:hypothetical protein
MKGERPRIILRVPHQLFQRIQGLVNKPLKTVFGKQRTMTSFVLECITRKFAHMDRSRKCRHKKGGTK